MDETINQTTDSEENVKGSENDSHKPPFVPETNDQSEKHNETNSAEIKAEPLDDIGHDQTTKPLEGMPLEIQDNNDGCAEIATIPFETAEVRVKDEPSTEEAIAIDYGMPIAKTTENTDAMPLFDMENIKLSANSASMETTEDISNCIQQGNAANSSSSMYLNETAAKSALDAFLDGIATPIAPVRPRLRVKSEFAIIPQLCKSGLATANDSFNENNNSMETEILPPPPPLFSSTSNSDHVADGIATPRISLAATNRLRVKTEFSTPFPTPQHNTDYSSVPDNFLDDPIVNNEIKKEPGEISGASDEDSGEGEPIPADYFDDLLHDKLKERIEEAQSNEMEEKYSDILKEHERLKKEFKIIERRKMRKKQKKAKKKSRKRSRSRSASPGNKGKERKFCDNKTVTNFNEINRSHKDMPSCSNYANKGIVEEDCLRVYAEPTAAAEKIENVEEILTPKQKRERAVKRATALLEYIKERSANKNSHTFSSFPFVSTVRKLPTSHSYVQQESYENRSPLHIVNNVSYKFNSHTTRFNMQEWGLAALPTHAAKLAKLVGCSAQLIHDKLRTIKIPVSLKNVKQEPTSNEAEIEEEELIETTSSLYNNAMTQTDDASEFNSLSSAKCYEVGIQAEPTVYSIGCQTLETQSPTENLHIDDEAPIMKIIQDLNENQLMAIHQFAELIKEPNTNASSMAMYKIQMKIVDIYKISQIPSSLDTPQTQMINNNYTSTTPNRPPHYRGGGYQKREHEGQQQQLIIQSVVGADGNKFSINDPRSQSAAYTQRIVNDSCPSSSNYDPRYSTFPHNSHAARSSRLPYARSTGGEGRQYPVNNQTNAATTKYFGRGGLRR